MLFRPSALTEEEIHTLLGNPRRRGVLERLYREPGSLRAWDLAVDIAREESGHDEPPPAAKNAVYVSLHQTHLPRLDELGVVRYDRDSGEVTLRRHVRELERYMMVDARSGVTWAAYYRTLGVVGLFLVVAALVELPPVAALEPVLLATLFLLAFTVSTAYQLWTRRAAIVAAVRD